MTSLLSNIKHTHTTVPANENSSLLLFPFSNRYEKKPKPILVDKQSSEPNSPIAKTFEEQQNLQKRPPMHRGYSDLGNRIKKRVTLR